MKQRFSYLDLRIVTNGVDRELRDAYLQNIYSLEDSKRHFLLKFDSPNGTGKRFLIVDPGMRYHLTKYQHEPTKQPSHFVQQLRKFLRNRRATDFWVQPGSRLMVITFNGGQYFLVFEFFAAGNIILLEESHKILALYRVVRDVGPSKQNIQPGEQYLIDKSGINDAGLDLQPYPSKEDLAAWVLRDKLGKALYSKVSDPSSSLLEYYLREQGLDPKRKLEDLNDLDKVELAVKDALDHAHRLITAKEDVKGYIMKDGDTTLEFEPFPDYFRLVHPDYQVDEYPTYNQTVDTYFGALLSDKGVNKVDQLHDLANSRLAAARSERQKRISGLEKQQQLNAELGSAIQVNAALVDAAISAVKSLVDQGVDWGDAANLIQLEKKNGNPVAQIVDSLDLENHKAILKLPRDQDVFHDDDVLTSIKVAVSIDRSAHANARDYFEIRKAAGAKIEKTEQHADKALRSAEIKIKRDLEANLAKHQQASTASKLHSIRETHWFEKFWWFLTSTRHVVIAAREKMQYDLMLRRYFQEKDVALTSDAPDATLVIIKNPEKVDIAPQTLLQAAAFAVATSAKVWEAKSKSPSWFLTRAQVPKINERGDPISMNDFRNIKGRTIVPPTPLDMGFALLWQLEVPEQDSEKEERRGEESEEDFPDTQIDSDEDFPDTNVDSEVDEDSDEEGTGDESDEQETKSDGLDTAKDENSEDQQDIEGDDGVADDDYQDDQDSSDEVEDESEVVTEDGSVSPRATPPVVNAPKKIRGAKKKLKKYLAQDEEDRRAAMERLGTLKGLERKAAEKESQERAARQVQEREIQRKERRRKAELALMKESEAVPEYQPFPVDLVNKYKEDEPVIAAVPMFAPWSAIQQIQYKAKLVPGSLKKGKASNELLRIILNTSVKPASDREKLLVEAIKPVDVQQEIAVSRVQVATATSVKDPKKKQAKPGKKRK